MKKVVYNFLETGARLHWWNISRDKIVFDSIAKLAIPFESIVIELGVGTGSLLRKLRFHHKIGIDSYL